MLSADGGNAPVDALIGQQLGKDYRVIERIGAGGMGVVYLVEHASLRKRFAAKVLSKELAADAEARARFQIEAHAASQLEHENIVTLTDFGLTADGRPYIVMELLRGRTLDARLAEGPLELEEIVAIVIPVARALAEAHAEGIIHRDVKPENVFLTVRSGGRWGVKVLDFGIAKTPTRGSKLTKTGQALGSPMYMAPEACRGEEIDHRADIYSLGVLMYLLWCGKVPFDDDNLLKVLQMQVADPVPSPRALRPDLSDELEAVILQALEKDPDRRFLSIAMLMAALEEALPPGADRLLIEAARGTTTMRVVTDRGATPFPIQTTPRRLAATADALATGPTRPALQTAPLPAPTIAAVTLAPATPPARRGRVAIIAAAVGAAALALGAVLVLGGGGGHGRSTDAPSAPVGGTATLPTEAHATPPAPTPPPPPPAAGSPTDGTTAAAATAAITGAATPAVPTTDPTAAIATTSTTPTGPTAATDPTGSTEAGDDGPADPAGRVTAPGSSPGAVASSGRGSRSSRGGRHSSSSRSSSGRGAGSGAGSSAGSGRGSSGPDLGIRTSR